MFKNIYDIDLEQIPAYELAPAGATPPPGVLAAYDAMADAIGEFEKSRCLTVLIPNLIMYWLAKHLLLKKKHAVLPSSMARLCVLPVM